MMQRIFSFGLAAFAATCLTQPVYAHGGGGSGSGMSSGAGISVSGGHASGGSGFHSGAVHNGGTAHFSSPGGGGEGHFNHGANFAGHSAVMGTSAVPSGVHASTAAAAAVIGHTSAATAPVGRVNRAFSAARTSNPTVAFAGTTAAIRGGGRAFSPPGDVTRNWDRNRFHSWNHHRYRSYGGGWIYWDDGFPDDDLANTDNDQPYQPYQPYPPYPPPVNGVMDNGQPPANGGPNYDQPAPNNPPAMDGSDYGTPDTLIVSVQNALTHLGYVTGVSNGTFGPMTENALSNFQRDHRLSVTGRIDGHTLKALGLL